MGTFRDPRASGGYTFFWKVHQRPAFFAAVLCCPSWAAHGGYTYQRYARRVGRRVHHAATYISGGADHVGPTRMWLAAVRGFRGNPSPVVVVGCRVRLLVGGFLALVVFPLLDFMFDVDEISTP